MERVAKNMGQVKKEEIQNFKRSFHMQNIGSVRRNKSTVLKIFDCSRGIFQIEERLLNGILITFIKISETNNRWRDIKPKNDIQVSF